MAKHVYVHVPFCSRRCSYCDFAIAVRRTVPVNDFLGALEREIRLRSAGMKLSVDTIYLGGGTPSRLGPDGVQRVLELVCSRFEAEPGAEITIEANPEDVTGDVARQWRTAGINRVSLGVQSFNENVLRWMHRSHDVSQAAHAAALLKDAGFEDWSLDLIFALPPEIERSWQHDLQRAIALEPPHISCYGLTVEAHTPLLRWRERGVIHEADEERYESEYLEGHRVLSNAGYEHYEVSNYAKAGRASRHNAAYWKRVPYLGFGPSAHSFDGGSRRWNAREYVDWRERILSGLDPVAGTESLDAAAVALEEVYLGLRSSEGFAVSGVNAADFDRWRDRGWANVVEGVGRLTPSGWLRLDSLVADLTDLRSRY